MSLYNRLASASIGLLLVSMLLYYHIAAYWPIRHNTFLKNIMGWRVAEELKSNGIQAFVIGLPMTPEQAV